MTRNWKKYNEELEEMNDGKVGRPYEFPKSYIQFVALWYEFFHLPYRQLEGALRKLGELVPELKASDYTSLWHRFKDLELEIPENEDKVVAAVDATGVKVTNRGEWLRKYHKGKRGGWIKVHVAVDAESEELLSIEVTDERTGDSEVFEEPVENLDVDDCLADGAYDSEEIFEILEEKGVGPPGIKIRENATPSLSPRGEAVREFQEQGYEEWKGDHDYGKRWAVEGFFSIVKRYFGETMRAASPEGMVREVKRKFALYNLVTRI